MTTTTKRPTRRGNWLYDPTCGWRLDGTDLVLDYDRLDRGCAIPGAWVLHHGPRYLEPIDHYLDAAMRWVENNQGRYRAAVSS